jgi:hypothetical protein
LRSLSAAVLAALSILLTCGLAALAAGRSAPADEYFGRMKLSYLGINNTFKDNVIRAGPWTILPTVINPVRDADQALRDWEHKYPSDPQLARSYYLATLAFRKIYTKEFQNEAWDYMHVIIKRYPKTFFAKQVRSDIARGYTEHYFAEPLPCPSATAPPAQPQFLPPQIGTRTRATPTPTPTPSPSPTPSPTPTPTPAPGQPGIDLLPAACIPPETPTPRPTPTPTPSPSPLLNVPTLPPATPRPSPTPVPVSKPTPAPPTPTPAPSPLVPVPTPVPTPAASTTPVPSPRPSPKPSASHR